MKKLLMLFAAVFALSATSIAQVEAPAPATSSPSVKMKKKRVRTDQNTKQIPRNMRTASTPEKRTAMVLDRMNEKLTAKDASLALTEEQRSELTEIYMQRQMIQQSRPKLETEEDKIAFRESRKAAAKEFKEKLDAILTPAQHEVYLDSKRDKRGARKMKDGKKMQKAVKKNKPSDIEKSQKF